MTTILPVKLSIHSLPLKCETNSLKLIVTFNTLSEIFSPPFDQLPMYLVNFPTVSTLLLKFLKDNKSVFEASASLNSLLNNNFIELPINFTPTENNLGENARSSEITALIPTSSECYLKIERTDIDKSSFSLEFEQFLSLSQKSLEISMGMKNKNERLENSEKLGMEIFDIQDLGQMTPQRLKNIKCLFVGINEKLKVFEILKDRMEKAEECVGNEVDKREALQRKFRKMCLEYLGIKENLDREVKALEGNVSDLKCNNEKVGLIQKAFDDYKLQKELEIEVLSGKLQQLQSIHSADQLRGRVGIADAPELPKKLDNSNELEKLLSECQDSIQQLTSENGRLSTSNQDLQLENAKLKEELITLNQESLSLKSHLLELESRCMYGTELEAQLLKVENELKKVNQDFEVLQNNFKDVNENFLQGNKGLYEDKAALMETNKKLNEDYITLKAQLIDIECKYLELQGKSYESTQETSVSYTALTQQNLQLLKDSKDFCEASNKLETSMLKEYNLVVETLLNISSDHLLLQRLQTRILQYLRDKDAEVLALKKVMGEIQKQKAAYVPVRGDFIDNQLANFLNSSPIPIEIPFTRLEQGIYLFGTKRVVLRVENIGIVIRVGGGFIKIEEFINNQTVFEVGKIKERENRERKSMFSGQSPDVKDRRGWFPSPEGKERKFKGPSPVPEEKKVIYTVSVTEDLERPPSPKVLYTQRSSISSGIPMPKTVSTLIERKSTMDGKKRSSAGSLPSNF